MNRKQAFTFITIILIAVLAITACALQPSDKEGSISGRVLLEGGEPGANVYVSATDKNSPEGDTYYTSADEDGSYKIEGLAPSTYSVTFRRTGYSNGTKDNVVVETGKNVDLGTITLKYKTGIVSGKVSDESGNPLKDAEVTIMGNGYEYSVKTDKDGLYSLRVKTGKYTDLDITYPHHNLKSTIDITVKDGSETAIPEYSIPEAHNYVFTELKEPTYTEAGYRKYKCTDCTQEEEETIPPIDLAKWAGVRVSSYGMEESFEYYPGVTEMLSFGEKMESCYEGSLGTYILIVGVVSDDLKDCFLNFPLSKEIDHVIGSEEDYYETYLTAMDEAGYSVWLQVEPGEADLVELAKEVMNHYKHHSCVKGFGIDVEWYKRAGNKNGMKLNGDGEPNTASKVLTTVKAIDNSYSVFVKHWDRRWLPEPKKGLVFVDDSQGFRERGDKTALERMCEEFAAWANYYSPCPVMFQIGYENDETNVWGSMENPAKELGTAIIEACYSNNDIGIIWVDFTLKEVLEKIPTE